MSVADLSPGDKLSLKGKIFELQKKLNLLDVEQQNTEEYTFQPEITQYKLPHRGNDFIHNMKRSEDSRKEKLESLKEMVMLESGNEYTYRPSINKASQSRKSKKPIFIRLNEKGKEYQESLEKRIIETSNYDSNGRKLFVPQRVVQKPPPDGEMQVEEYLYRDAQDRAARRQVFAEEESRGREKLATERKMNKKSELLVRRKNERELRAVFETLVEFSSHNLDPTSSGHESPRINLIGLQQITEYIQRKYHHHLKDDSPGASKTLIASFSEPFDLAERIWNILDPEEVGAIDVHSFIAVCLPILFSRGGKGNIAHIFASSITSNPTLDEIDLDISRTSDQNLLYKFLKYENETVLWSLFLRELSDFAGSRGLSSTAPNVQSSSKNSLDIHARSSVDSDRVLNYNEILLQREKLAKDRMEELRYQLYEEKMKECTFNPQISNVATRLQRNSASPSSQGSQSSSPPAYLRLYRQKDQLPRSMLEKKHRTHEERELDGCTFVPTIYSHFEKAIENGRMESFKDEKELENELMKEKDHAMNLDMNSTTAHTHSREDGDSHTLPATPNGFSETVQRMRNALERRKQKEKEDSDIFAFNEENYLKKKQLLAKEGCKPFRLRTEERQTEKLKALQAADSSSLLVPSGSQKSGMGGFVRRGSGGLKPVRLYVEIKLGGGVKGSHIAVADGDIPAHLAKTFCRIYSLDVGAESILTDVLTNHMIQNGIPIGTIQPKLTQHDIPTTGSEFEEDAGIEDSETLQLDDFSSTFENM